MVSTQGESFKRDGTLGLNITGYPSKAALPVGWNQDMYSRPISLFFGFCLAQSLMPGQVFADHRPNNIAVMSGSWSVTGKYLGAGDSFLKGRELYVEQLNARDGLLGHRVELKILDDKSERRNAIMMSSFRPD